MKTIPCKHLAAMALAAALATTSPLSFADAPSTPGFNTPIPAKIMTPDTVQTRLGTLKFVDGVPTAETAQKAYENLDFLRGVEVFLNFIPAASLEAIREGQAGLGAVKSHQALIFDQLLDSNPLLLTGNTDTVSSKGLPSRSMEAIAYCEPRRKGALPRSKEEGGDYKPS